ncbi:hypothetical protein TVAG_411050 [Trichomonas vaginalis G3]|uniref:C2 NT-type domain-containing protein n=1 Tax=Trichomonas vaginalis (strain ATCC PRA-98 / G3) TaxID=412133 RepID=A2DXL0_TRIV3|nr:hypothetical protein TVAGG3_0047930 [Trichomonas vaginalis G3]EAY14839.1 hypothetical protein TVAG_411050 [Trichomonas vaginalis G3]KAI5541180.1 hypothetical protein TVAGG3_0047930 [Trichomonas vaginalis G3]|eukprot:XP_001327062.1 hypothetical protein [Trichomonas vaginalis G3]
MIDFQKRVAYIRLDKFDLGNFNVDYGAKIVASVGTRSSLLRNAKDFDFLDKNPQKVWELRYHNPNTTSFIFTLAKKRIFGGDIPIGEVELKLSNFETNTVVKCDCKLRNPSNRRLNSTVTLSIHVCEDGSAPFNAPDANIVSSSYLVRKSFM